MLAAEELVHQLRLRDIGGIIIVDFIDMDSKEHQQQLYDYVRKLMSHDRAKHNVLPLSKFGLMQITRQRVRPAVEVDVMEVCPTCMGKGKIQPSILFTDQVEEEIGHFFEHYGKGLRLHLHPYVYSYVCRGWFNSLKCQWRRKYGVRVVENQSLGMLEMRFYDAKGNILKHQEEPQEQPKQPQKQQPKEQPKAQPKKEPAKAEQPKAQQPAEQKAQPAKKQPKAKQPKKETSKEDPTKQEKPAEKVQTAQQPATAKKPKAQPAPKAKQPKAPQAKPAKETAAQPQQEAMQSPSPAAQPAQESANPNEESK